MTRLYILCVGCLVVGGCSSKDKPTKEVQSVAVSVIADVTDKKSLWPDSKALLQLFDCQSHPDAQCHFSLAIISDKRANPVYSSQLPDGETTEKQNRAEDQLFRKKNILRFYENVRKDIDRFYTDYDTAKSLQYSECWASIAKALIGLAAKNANEKYLVVHSDLQELSAIGNAYKSREGITPEVLEKEYPVPDSIGGIRVVIVYRPKDRADDMRFQKMLAVYTTLLKQHGVTVTHQATNDNLGKQ